MGILSSLISRTPTAEIFGFNPRVAVTETLEYPNPLQLALSIVTVFVCDELELIEYLNIDLWDILKWYPKHNTSGLFQAVVRRSFIPEDPIPLIHLIYLITHIVYVFTAYSPTAAIDPNLLPYEFHFLKNVLELMVISKIDVDAGAEALECLKIFLRFPSPDTPPCNNGNKWLCVNAVDILEASEIAMKADFWLWSVQKEDGSWGGQCESECVATDTVHATFAVLWALGSPVHHVSDSNGIVFVDVTDVLRTYPSFEGFDFGLIRNGSY
eukprot:c11801_g1_i1.p1 GENE.c11801_g1_i1~~c11801_g1_i1.p1  ORF type:complete len:269 (-),score=93.63 c11801_g1_i1:243-1049(-)